MPTEPSASSPSSSWGKNMTAAPQRAAVTVTAGVPPQATLTPTRNLDSVPVEVSDRNHNEPCQCCHNGLFFLTVVGMTVFGQTPLQSVETLTEIPAASPLCSWANSTTPVPVREEEMASCGALPLTTTMMTRNGASVLTRVSHIKIE